MANPMKQDWIIEKIKQVICKSIFYASDDEKVKLYETQDHFKPLEIGDIVLLHTYVGMVAYMVLNIENTDGMVELLLDKVRIK